MNTTRDPVAPKTPAAQADPEATQPLKAAFWMMGAIVSFSTMAVAGRAVAVELDTFELMLYRSIIGLCIVICVARLAGTLGTVRARRMPLHFMRNISHFAGQNLWFAAISLAPLAQVIAIEFTSPIWIVLLAPLVLGETLTRRRIAVAVIGFIGAMMVARPDMSAPETGVIFAALAAIGFAGSALFTKMLTRTESVTSILFWLTLMQFMFGALTASWDLDVVWPSLAVWPWVVLVSVTGLSAHFCLTAALTLAPAVTVMPLDFARLPVIAGIGILLYSEPLDPWVIAGASIIFSANYINILLEARKSRRA